MILPDTMVSGFNGVLHQGLGLSETGFVELHGWGQPWEIAPKVQMTMISIQQPCRFRLSGGHARTEVLM